MTSTNDSTIAYLADATERGDRAAADALFAALYSELHRLARRELARQGMPLGLSATTLLHQAYLDMTEREGPAFPDRVRFMGYAARVMRGRIIDHVAFSPVSHAIPVNYVGTRRGLLPRQIQLPSRGVLTP
jgi:hypothetical protein